MRLDELQSWILSSDGLGRQLTLLSRYAAAQSVGLDVSAGDIAAHRPDWARLLLAGSILSGSTSEKAHESALMVAQAGLLYSDNRRVADASATLLTQLANHRA